MAVIKQFDVEFLGKDELKEGDTITILTEPKADSRFKGIAVCEVSSPSGEKKLFSFNKTSFFSHCVPVWGKDTVAWVGKTLVYKGMQKMGNMQGRLFVPKE